MGLQMVEVILRLEEEFEIKIPDADAEQLLTVGAFSDYICAVTGETSELERARMWARVRAVMADEISVPQADIWPHSRIIEDLHLG